MSTREKYALSLELLKDFHEFLQQFCFVLFAYLSLFE